MDQKAFGQRLSRIETQWSALIEANDGPTEVGIQSRGHLIQRYSAAVYRYLLGAVHDPDVAEELGQEFAIRFLRGDFKRANPDRGKFRNYVKTVLINLVNDYHRSRAKSPSPLQHDVAGPQESESANSEEDFLKTWRGGLLDRTWQSLAEANPSYHATLLLKIEEPDLSSREMAEQLSQSLAKPMTAAGVRKTLERAHTKFADLLLDEVATSIDATDLLAIQAELQALDLLKYCRSAVERRATKKS